MADEVEIAKNFLDTLSGASEFASAFKSVSKILEKAGKLTSAFPLIGAVLGLFECFLPDDKHEEILRCFEELNNKVDQVREDIKELEKMIKWEVTELQYGEVVGRIKLGMEFCTKIGIAAGKERKARYQERLKEVCANQNFTLSLTTLLDGITGQKLFQKSILDEFYIKTGGDRPKISALSTRLLQLVCGGMMVIATYETVVRGKEGAEEETKRYDDELKEAYAKVQSVTDRCVKNFETNMLNDLKSKLERDRSNRDIVSDLMGFMSAKYDWLENYCLVYNDIYGFEKHCYNGNRVDSLHRNGKCGIVFYRPRGDPPRFSNRYDEAYKIVDNVYCGNAQGGYKNIVSKLGEKGIGWSGCAVIKRFIDLWFGGNFSTRTISIVGKDATAILLLQ